MSTPSTTNDIESPVMAQKPSIENSTPFWSEELDLEDGDGSKLGDTQNAKAGHGVADISVGRTRLDAVCTDLVYGFHESLGACRILLDFTIGSDADFRLKTADLTCVVGNESSISSPVSSVDVVRPMVLKCGPPDINDDNPTVVGIERGTTITPEVNVQGIVSFSGVGHAHGKTYNETWGWHMHSSIGSSNAQTSTTRDLVNWSFTANRMQKDSTAHTFSIEALIRHDGRPFFADFTLEARLAFGASVRTIGRRKKVTNRRHFIPVMSGVTFP